MKTPSATEIRRELKKIGDPAIAEHSKGFFKTGPGEYGEGDQFIGVRVPVLRKLAKNNRDLPLRGTLSLLRSRVHEERLLALILMTLKYQKGSDDKKQEIFELYCANTQYINNWDLVDCSAHKIVGPFLMDRNRKPLYQYASSESLWERRIAIMSTLAFIKESDFDETLAIADILLDDKEDLIHKAVGWMLREVGRQDRKVEESFIRSRYRSMPRTMLRYAIEHFEEPIRKRYLAGRV